MDTDISQCPENGNSTDCLLRTLLQLLKEYREADNVEVDWDPINFAFTLLIGLIAILFALATIVQAVFAAGKGRRRTSDLAIGKWCGETTREWDWSEMNFRITATTPILHEQFLLSTWRKEYDFIEHARHTLDIIQAKLKAPAKPKFWDSVKSIASLAWLHPNRHQSSESQHNQSRRASAAWLEFFKEVGLDELGVEAWGTSTRTVVTNYLPDDITAAPAYAQVGAIIAAAATAGIQKVSIDRQTSRNYPVVFGQGFQIDFRQHPALGVVGAYSRYDDTRKGPRKLDIDELMKAIQNGRGLVDDITRMDLSTGSTRQQLIERWSEFGKAHAVPSTLWSATFALKSSAISEAHLPLIVGMFADIPKHVPALFPIATIRTNTCLTALALNGKYWAEVDLDEFREPDISRLWKLKTPTWHGFVWSRATDWENTMSSEVRELYHEADIKNSTGKRYFWDDPWSPDTVEWLIAHAKDIMVSIQAERKKRAAEAEGSKAAASQGVIEEAGSPIAQIATTPDASDGEPTIYPQEDTAKSSTGHLLVLQMCLGFLHNPAFLEQWFSEDSSQNVRFLRSLVREQLESVDEWLRDKKESRHRSILLCNTTIVLLQLEKMIGNGFFNSSGRENCQGDRLQGGSVKQQQTEGRSRGRPGQGIAGRTHLNILQVLCNMVVSREARGARELESLLWDWSASTGSLLWDRLIALVAYHFEDEPQKPSEDQVKHDSETYDKESRDIDDVIIYRCLMMILLFRTAADSGEILESGIWDQVVPII